MPHDLSVPLRVALVNLRQNPALREILTEIPKTSLHPYSLNKPSADQHEKYIYNSGIIEGEQRIINFLLNAEMNVPSV